MKGGQKNPRAKENPNQDPESKSAKRIENQERQIVNLKKRIGGGADLWQGSRKVRGTKGGGKGKGKKGKGKGKGKGKKGKGKNKSKGKGKTKKGKFDKAMPTRLIGGRSQDDSGNNFCYGFNLGNCKSKAGPGGECDKGKHKCMKKGCNGSHAFVDCVD